jgi:hypothetical protein
MSEIIPSPMSLARSDRLWQWIGLFRKQPLSDAFSAHFVLSSLIFVPNLSLVSFGGRKRNVMCSLPTEIDGRRVTVRDLDRSTSPGGRAWSDWIHAVMWECPDIAPDHTRQKGRSGLLWKCVLLVMRISIITVSDMI